MVKPVLSQRCRCCLSLHWDKRRCCFNTHCCAALWTGCKWYSEGTDTWTNCSGANPPHINNIHWKNEGSSKPRNLCTASLCIYYCNAPYREQPGHMFVEGRSELRKDKRMQIEDSTNRHSWKEWKCASEKKGNKACSSWREPFQHLQDPYAYSCTPYNLSFLHIIFFFLGSSANTHRKAFEILAKKYLWSVLIPHENPVCGCLIKPPQRFTVTGCWPSLEEEAGTARGHT